MLEYQIGDMGKINGWATEVDYHAGQLQDSLTKNPDQDENFRQVLEISSDEDHDLDMFVNAHHRKFVLKYRHVIRDQDGRAALFGGYQLFEFEQAHLSQDRLVATPILSFDIDPNGNVEINGKHLSCSPNPVYAAQDRQNFKKQILFAIQRYLVAQD